jgi:hypothetical protein
MRNENVERILWLYIYIYIYRIVTYNHTIQLAIFTNQLQKQHKALTFPHASKGHSGSLTGLVAAVELLIHFANTITPFQHQADGK